MLSCVCIADILELHRQDIDPMKYPNPLRLKILCFCRAPLNGSGESSHEDLLGGDGHLHSFEGGNV